MASTPVVKIAMFGDDEVSDIAISSMGMASLVTPSEESDLQTALQSEFSDSGISVANDATGGLASSLPNELDGMDGGGAAEPQRMEQSGASIVIQEHMLNDALGGETAAEYSAYLAQWIQDARAAGLTPVLEESGPACDGNHPFLPQYVAAMDAAAVQYNVPLVQNYAYIQSIDGWCSHMVGGIYPDATILALKAKQEQAVIAPLVQKIIGGQS
jgi:hypothetical protein